MNNGALALLTLVGIDAGMRMCGRRLLTRLGAGSERRPFLGNDGRRGRIVGGFARVVIRTPGNSDAVLQVLLNDVLLGLEMTDVLEEDFVAGF